MNELTLIVDYGLCNLDSVNRAVEELGGRSSLSTRPSDLERADRVILPGVGAFADGMSGLRDRGWIEPLRDHAVKKKKPLLGICLGMQMLATTGVESGSQEGLGFIAGQVVRLKPEKPTERVPHIGWNEVYFKQETVLTRGIRSGSDFYFVHSYHYLPENPEAVAATTEYCGTFASIIHEANIFGVQFHPEKSQHVGFQLLKNFLQAGAL